MEIQCDLSGRDGDGNTVWFVWEGVEANSKCMSDFTAYRLLQCVQLQGSLGSSDLDRPPDLTQASPAAVCLSTVRHCRMMVMLPYSSMKPDLDALSTCHCVCSLRCRQTRLGWLWQLQDATHTACHTDQCRDDMKAGHWPLSDWRIATLPKLWLLFTLVHTMPSNKTCISNHANHCIINMSGQS